MSKNKTKNIGSDLEQLHVFKALCNDNTEHNAGSINASNPEYLSVFKVPCGDNPEQNMGLLLAPAEGFGLWPRFFWIYGLFMRVLLS